MIITKIALLRGINVGGNHKVDMKTLKVLFENLGYKDVRTYINSGNVVFNTEAAINIKELEKQLAEKFHFKIALVIIDAKNLIKLTKEIPNSWTNNKELKTDVMFLTSPLYDIKKELVINSEVDFIKIFDNVIVWHINRANYSKSGISKLVGTNIYKNMTIRNINTVRKLATLV